MVVHIPFRKVPEDVASIPERCSATSRIGRMWDTWNPRADIEPSSRGGLGSLSVRPEFPETKNC